MVEESQSEALEYRAEAAEAQANGDTNAANEAYLSELSALETTEDDVQGEDVESFDSEGIFTYLTDEFDAETVGTLRAHWTDPEAAQEGIALGQALVEDHPELIDIASEFGLQDHPGLLAMAATFAKRLGYTYTATGTQREETSMAEPNGNLSRESYTKAMREFNERISLAQGEGNHSLANDLYIKQQEWIASVKGNDSIVGSQLRNA